MSPFKPCNSGAISVPAPSEKYSAPIIPNPAALPNSVFCRATAPGTSILTGTSCFAIRMTISLWLEGKLGFLHELGFQLHGANAIDLAVDVVVAFHEADIAHLGADLHHRRCALDLQVLDHRDAVSVLKHVSMGITHHGGLIGHCRSRNHGPFMGALGADVVPAIFVGVFRTAGGAMGQLGHDWVPGFS